MIDPFIIGACAGAIGGLVKSVLEHKGKLMLPYRNENFLVTGCLVDVIGGMAVGLSFAEPAVYLKFGIEAPGFWLSFISGSFWLAVLQRLIGFLPIGTNGTKNPEIEARKMNRKLSNTMIIPLL